MAQKRINKEWQDGVEYVPAIRKQQAIHEKFVKSVLVGENERYAECIAQFPELKGAVKPEVFMGTDANAILGGVVETCLLFGVKDETAEGLEFDSERSKSVKQTVKANADYYKKALGFYNEETEDVYKEKYKAILSALLSYFSEASEGLLEDYYGAKYIDFKNAELEK